MADIVRVKLHNRQSEVFWDPSRFKVVVAGRRFGKTHLALYTLIEKAKKPRQEVWYVAPTYGMARQIMWRELKWSIPGQWIKKIHETFLQIELINGSLIKLKGSDKPDSLRGVGLNYVVCDEFQDMKDFTWTEVLRATLSTSRGHAMFIGTPKSFNHFHDLYAKGQDKDIRGWKSWQFPTIMSPFVPKDEIEAARRDLDSKTFRQEFEASFESMSGLVYYPFDRELHVGDYPFNPDLPIWVGQDFNIDPMSSVILQPQPSGEVWVVDEIVINNSNVTDVCNELERRYWRHQTKIAVYPDPSGVSRGHARGESALDIFRERGFKDLRFRKKHPPVQDRINAVNSMLFSADGTIKLRFDRGCRNVIEACEQVIYKSGSPEVDKSLNKEHVLDAMGYCLEKEFSTRRVKILGINI